MRIQHNIMAMNAYRNYMNNTSALSKNLEKLSSGYRINRAGDDAAGLAISEKMRAQITGLDAAQKNVADGISLVQTAEGAMQEIQDMLNRMVYLATQSSNETFDNEVDRANLQKELTELRDEINRIADSANFNGIKLLDGSLEKGNDLAAVGEFSATGAEGATALLPEGTVLGTNTVVHQEASSANAGTVFAVDLHDVAFDDKADSKLTINVGGATIELAGATGAADMSAEDIVAAIVKGDTNTVNDVTGVAANADGKQVVTINNQEFAVSDGGNGRLVFTQLNVPKNDNEVVSGSMSVNISGVGVKPSVGGGTGAGEVEEVEPQDPNGVLNQDKTVESVLKDEDGNSIPMENLQTRTWTDGESVTFTYTQPANRMARAAATTVSKTYTYDQNANDADTAKFKNWDDLVAKAAADGFTVSADGTATYEAPEVQEPTGQFVAGSQADISDLAVATTISDSSVDWTDTNDLASSAATLDGKTVTITGTGLPSGGFTVTLKNGNANSDAVTAGTEIDITSLLAGGYDAIHGAIESAFKVQMTNANTTNNAGEATYTQLDTDTFTLGAPSTGGLANGTHALKGTPQTWTPAQVEEQNRMARASGTGGTVNGDSAADLEVFTITPAAVDDGKLAAAINSSTAAEIGVKYDSGWKLMHNGSEVTDVSASYASGVLTFKDNNNADILTLTASDNTMAESELQALFANQIDLGLKNADATTMDDQAAATPYKGTVKVTAESGLAAALDALGITDTNAQDIKLSQSGGTYTLTVGGKTLDLVATTASTANDSDDIIQLSDSATGTALLTITGTNVLESEFADFFGTEQTTGLKYTIAGGDLGGLTQDQVDSIVSGVDTGESVASTVDGQTVYVGMTNANEGSGLKEMPDDLSTYEWQAGDKIHLVFPAENRMARAGETVETYEYNANPTSDNQFSSFEELQGLVEAKGYNLAADGTLTRAEEEGPNADTSGQKYDFNVSTTVIQSVGVDGGYRLASTSWNLTKDMLNEGGSIKIGEASYTIGDGTGQLKISDLNLDTAEGIATAAERLTQLAKDNTVWTVGHQGGGRMTFTEVFDVSKNDEQQKMDLSKLENIEKSFGYTGTSKISQGLTLQIGDTSDEYNQLSVSIEDMHTDALGLENADGTFTSISDISVATQSDAKEAINVIKAAINSVSSTRGTLGATQNRLEHTAKNLSVMEENITNAESAIRDTDIAEEMMSYTKNNILIQSAQAMLAQANMVPQGVLQLLQ